MGRCISGGHYTILVYEPWSKKKNDGAKYPRKVQQFIYKNLSKRHDWQFN